MVHKQNIKTSSFSWLSSSYKSIDSSIVSNFYEPDTIDELINVCGELNTQKIKFLVIGHTSNLYFTPSCKIDSVVSTRKLNSWKFVGGGKILECECGVSVKRLSAEMVKSGFVGFAGLCDLPGTVAAAIYGNAGCYGCDLSSKLYSCDILLNDGLVKTYYKEDIEFSVRMSSFKSKAIEGVILRIRLALEKGSAEEEILKATEASTNRKKTQPGPLNNLGSIYSSKQTYTFKGRFLTLIAKGLSLLNRKSMLHNVLLLTGKKSLLPYVCHWNRYIWKDEKAHNLWPMFVKLHAQIFRNDKFEIEILT